MGSSFLYLIYYKYLPSPNSTIKPAIPIIPYNTLSVVSLWNVALLTLDTRLLVVRPTQPQFNAPTITNAILISIITFFQSDFMFTIYIVIENYFNRTLCCLKFFARIVTQVNKSGNHGNYN